VADWLYRHHIKYKYEPLIAPGTYGSWDPGWFITVPKFLFDNHPAQEPYDIPWMS